MVGRCFDIDFVLRKNHLAAGDPGSLSGSHEATLFGLKRAARTGVNDQGVHRSPREATLPRVSACGLWSASVTLPPVSQMRGLPPGQEPDEESPGVQLRLNGHGAQ